MLSSKESAVAVVTSERWPGLILVVQRKSVHQCLVLQVDKLFYSKNLLLGVKNPYVVTFLAYAHQRSENQACSGNSKSAAFSNVAALNTADVGNIGCSGQSEATCRSV